MISTTPSPTRNSGLRRGRRAFTLVEMMIGATLGGFIMLAVMTSFLFLGKSGANIQNYTDMESQARSALELFAEDVRQASTITWNNYLQRWNGSAYANDTSLPVGTSYSCTLTVNSVYVVYEYNSSTRVFRRQRLGSSRDLITGITAGTFSYRAFNVSGSELPLTTAAQRTTATSSTKQLQISLECMRQSSTAAAATNTVLSARFILRNKTVTA